MAYYLDNTDADAYVDIPSVTIGSTIGDEFEFEGYANAGNPSGNYRLAGVSSGFSAFVEMQATQVVIRFNSFVSRFFSTVYTQPAVGEEFSLAVRRVNTSEWRVFLNGVAVETVADSGNLTLGQFLRFATSTTECFLGGIKRITIKQGATTRVYDPSLSGGAGSTLPTNDGINEGTLVNFPADDSQWVFYDDGGAATDDLLASDLSSTSQVSSPAIAQTHALTANDVSSLSSVTAPVLGQTHSLTANDVQSTSQVSSPALATQANTDNLTADDIESASTTSSPAIGQVHNLAANDATSNTETGTPTLQQTHVLTSVDVSSLSTVSSPALTSVAGQDSLAANDIQATSTVSSPNLGQAHNLTANDLSSNSETDSPNMGQVHALTANDITSLSSVTAPTLRNASQVLVTPIKNTKATVSQTTYKAAIIQPVYKAEAG